MSIRAHSQAGSVLPAAAAIIVLASSLLLLAQTAQVVPRTAAAADQASDLSGVWEMSPDAFGHYDHTFSAGELPMTPWAKQKFDAARPSEGPKMVPIAQLNDPFYQCLPPGVPRIYLHPFAMEIVQTPKEFIQLFEYDHLVRRTYLDGRQHGDPDPTWMGDSIGHWEGSTLVVDSIGFNNKTWIDRVGHPHSERLHVVERFRRLDPQRLQLDLTLEDPVAYTEPITKQLVFKLQPTWKIMEHVCVDNQSFLDFEKKESTPPK